MGIFYCCNYFCAGYTEYESKGIWVRGLQQARKSVICAMRVSNPHSKAAHMRHLLYVPHHYGRGSTGNTTGETQKLVGSF